MNTRNKAVCGREIVSIRDVAWVLGVGQPVVCKTIRRGVLPLMRRRGRVGVPAAALARLLCPAGDEHDPAGRGVPGTRVTRGDTCAHVGRGDDGPADYGGGAGAGSPDGGA
jgi:hypothetical protein